MANNPKIPGSLTTKHWFGYMFGDWGGCMTFALMSSIFSIYCTNVLGINTKVMFVLTVIWTVWDAINDPMVGYWAVNHRFQNGEKCRPFALWCAVPWAITVVLMFTCFDVSYGLKFGIAISIYFLFELFNTFAAIPYNSMGSLATNRDEDRRAINVARNLGGCVGSAIGSLAGFVGIGCNLLLFAVKLLAGTLAGSVSITADALTCVCERVVIAPAVLEQLKEGERPLSPGMMYKHYAPSTPLVLLDGNPANVLAFLQREQADKSCAILCYLEEMPHLQHKDLFPVGGRDDLPTQAHCLFSLLREADKAGASIMYAHLPPRDGLGLALYNRMIRAAAYKIITLK